MPPTVLQIFKRNRKRNLYEFDESCSEKLVKSLQVNKFLAGSTTNAKHVDYYSAGPMTTNL